LRLIPNLFDHFSALTACFLPSIRSQPRPPTATNISPIHPCCALLRRRVRV